jgi:nucleoside-triphosphatase
MRDAILLTGPPGCGKTTAIRKVLERLEVEAHGFFTQEMREGGRRTGFKLITLGGQEGVLAHTSIGGEARVGKYGVDLSVMDGIAVDAIREGIAAAGLIVIDEIGPMELLSAKFRSVVIEALEADLPLLGTIMRRRSPFADRLKARQDVRVIEMRRGTTESIVEQIMVHLSRQGLY